MTTLLPSALRALAYLRAAWLAADKHDRPFLTMALKDVLAAPTLHEHREDCIRVLKQHIDLETQTELFNALHPVIP